MKESDMTPPCQEACCRHKHREAPEYDALIKRLNRIEGQVRGVRGMVEKEAYCTDILVQVSAIQSALNAFPGSCWATTSVPVWYRIFKTGTRRSLMTSCPPYKN